MRNNKYLVLSIAFPFLLSQIFVPEGVFAQSAPEPSVPAAASFSQSTPVNLSGLEPPSTVSPSAMPAQGTITQGMLNDIGSTVTNALGQTLVVDIAQTSTPGSINFAGSFANYGNLYVVSSSSQFSTATISSAQMYNAPGALLTTVLPQGGLSGYTNLISGLNLNLVATNFIANAGTISSAGNLTMTAPQIVNALPSNITASAPQIVASGNLNLFSSNITNAGLMAAGANLNIASQLASNMVLNNISGTLSALNGSINIRDSLFSEKYNFNLWGGDVLSKELNVFSGDGLIDVQLNSITSLVNVAAGEGYISAKSDIRIGNLVYSGDPIVNSGGDLVFQGDQDPPASGNYTTTCTATGIFSGNNAYIDSAHPVNLISTGGLRLNLSGFANLSGASIVSSFGNVDIYAGAGISTGNISSPYAIQLVTTNGDVQAGNLSSTNSFIHAQTGNGNVSTGALSSAQGVYVNSAKSFSAQSINVSGNVPVVDMVFNQATPFTIGGTGANIGSINVNGTAPDGGIYLINKGTGGITIASNSAFSISGPGGQGIALDAGTGILNLPSGTFSIDSAGFPGVIGLSAAQINTNGTILSANNLTGGQAGGVGLGTTTLNIGNGLTMHVDGTNGIAGITGYSGVEIKANGTPTDNLVIGFQPYIDLPLSISGQTLTATANGNLGNVVVAGGLTINTSGGSLRADGTGNGHGGYVQLVGRSITVNDPGLQLSASAPGGSGGYIRIFDYNTTGGNVSVGDVSAYGITGGDIDFIVNASARYPSELTRGLKKHVNVRSLSV